MHCVKNFKEKIMYKIILKIIICQRSNIDSLIDIRSVIFLIDVNIW